MWAFCDDRDVADELHHRRLTTQDMVAKIEKHVYRRAAEIKAALVERGLTPVESWHTEYEDTWYLLQLTNVKGAAADMEASLTRGVTAAESPGVKELREEYKELLETVRSGTLPGMTGAGRKATQSSSYASLNPDDDTTEPLITRDMEL